jgi:hypothetical protein
MIAEFFHVVIISTRPVGLVCSSTPVLNFIEHFLFEIILKVQSIQRNGSSSYSKNSIGFNDGSSSSWSRQDLREASSRSLGLGMAYVEVFVDGLCMIP